MGNPVKIVIGHRLGQGQNVARGIEKAGGVAVVIPGLGADMKLGDVMQKENADIGISFCGSGGAGAITAATKYGYKYEQALRTVGAGLTALRNGCTVLGFGFMDTEVLGRSIVEEYNKIQAGKK